MGAQLKQRLARLLKSFVRRRKTCLSAVAAVPSPPPLLAAAASMTTNASDSNCHQSRPPQSPPSPPLPPPPPPQPQPQPLNFLGLGLVYADLSAASVDDIGSDLRIGMSLVAQTSTDDAGGGQQRLLMKEEIRVPLRRYVADCLACGGGGDGSVGVCVGGGCDGPMSEVTVHSRLLDVRVRGTGGAKADADLARTRTRMRLVGTGL